jgi:hypothetical protein
MATFVIEDETHSEWQGEFRSEHEALVELRRRAAIPWDQAPNQAPCTNWRNCGRNYYVIEFDNTREPWTELKRAKVLEISASQVKWHGGIH